MVAGDEALFQRGLDGTRTHSSYQRDGARVQPASTQPASRHVASTPHNHTACLLQLLSQPALQLLCTVLGNEDIGIPWLELGLCVSGYRNWRALLPAPVSADAMVPLASTHGQP